MRTAAPVLLVILFLGLITLVGIVGILILNFYARSVDTSVVAIVSGAAGALAGILAKTERTAVPTQSESVTVTKTATHDGANAANG